MREYSVCVDEVDVDDVTADSILDEIAHVVDKVDELAIPEGSKLSYSFTLTVEEEEDAEPEDDYDAE